MTVPTAASPELEQVRERHRRFYLDLVEQANAGWRDDRAGWSASLSEEQANVRRALASAVESGDAECALRLCTGMTCYWVAARLFEEADRWFGSALALPSPDPATTAAAHIARGRLHWNGGRYHDALASAGAARSLYEGSDDRTGLAKAEADLGWYHFYAGNVGAAAAHLETALTYRDAAEPRVLINAVRGLAWMEMEQGDLSRAKATFEDAFALAEQHDDPRVRADTLVVYSNMLAKGGAFREAEDARRRLLPVLEETGDDEGLGHTLMRLHLSLSARGESEEAARMLDQVVALVESGRVEAGAALVTSRRAALAFAEGRLEEAARLAERAMEEADLGPERAADDWWPIVEALQLLADIHYEEGRRAEGAQRLREAAAATAAALTQSRGLLVVSGLVDAALCAHRHGDLEVATELVDQVEAAVSSWEDGSALAWARAHQALVRGRPDLQRQEVDLALEQLDEADPRAHAMLLYESALLHFEHGQFEAARDQLNTSLELARAHEIHRTGIACKLLLGRILRHAGPSSELDDLNGQLVRAVVQHPMPELECSIVEHLALCAGQAGDHAQTVELLASATAWRDQRRRPGPKLAQMELDEALRQAKEALPANRFAQRWSKGTATPVRAALSSFSGSHEP